MNLKIKMNNVLFLDIETVPQKENWTEVPKTTQELFAKKTAYQRKEAITPEDFYERAGIWAEFGKIICISVAYFTNEKKKEICELPLLVEIMKSKLLLDFKELLDTHFNKSHHVLCAHNGKEFDFPYIARRMISTSNRVTIKIKSIW